MSRPLAIVCAALAAALCLLAVAAPAAPAKDLTQELEAKESQLEETKERKGVLTTTISRYQARIHRLTGAVAAIRNREAVTQARLATEQERLATANDLLERSRDHLARLRDHLRAALQSLRERLVAMYETGRPELLDVIIGQGDLEDVEARAEYLNAIHTADEAAAGRVRELRDGVALTVERRAAAKGEIEHARDVIAAEASELIATRSALQSRQGELVSARGDREATLAKLRHHETELDGDVEAIQGKIAEELAATGSMPLPLGAIKPGSGSMIWPVDGPIASSFGPRTIEGSYEYHPGIDIAVPEGTPIRAALTGSVAFTEPEASSGGYGNFTCIDHGGGLSTCYAHQSAFAVSAGDAVQQGEVIGYSGCTGYCLGPHVHFEVRINGEVVDPLGYL
ncbi:MAG: peptidoglycan DD-metalloendopeptidase family protein [Actinobacteria bacterium]|nr:peptidoglycan DD-metalloendopeptidase family protein [Actinomycetota bacterium]